MRLLAPVSVLSRGLDRAYRSARQAEIAHRDHDARARTETALAEGDASDQFEALRAEIAALRVSVDQWLQLAVEEEQRAGRFQAEAEKVPAHEVQIEQLTVAFRAIPMPTEVDVLDVDPWTDLPELVVADISSADAVIV